MNNTKVQTLDDLIQYSKLSDFSIVMSSFLVEVDNNIFSDSMIYDKYRSIILDNCQHITLDSELWSKYMYKPELLSMDLYGTPVLSHLVLYLNGRSAYKFVNRQLYLLPPSVVQDVIVRIYMREAKRLKRNKISIAS